MSCRGKTGRGGGRQGAAVVTHHAIGDEVFAHEVVRLWQPHQGLHQDLCDDSGVALLRVELVELEHGKVVVQVIGAASALRLHLGLQLRQTGRVVEGGHFALGWSALGWSAFWRRARVRKHKVSIFLFLVTATSPGIDGRVD